MAIIHGKSDSLNTLLSQFKDKGIYNYKTLGEIKQFILSMDIKYEEYLSIEQSYVNKNCSELEFDLSKKESVYRDNIEKEEGKLRSKMKAFETIILSSTSEMSIFHRFFFYFKRLFIKFKLFSISKRFNKLKLKPFIADFAEIKELKSNIEKLKSLSKSDLESRANGDARLFFTTRRCINNNFETYLGAIGEQEVIDTLSNLSDDFHIINNANVRFDKPVYNKKLNERVYSAQFDHVVVAPSGVFLIETKNWSQKTFERSKAYTPMDQLRRSSFALYCYLNEYSKSWFINTFFLKNKIKVRNVLVMTSYIPKIKSNYVKIVSTKQLLGYINYFKPIFSDKEVHRILNRLI